MGKPTLRQKIIADSGATDTLNIDNVLLTTGATLALFIIHSSLLNKEDHALIVRPNYSANVDVPKLIGCNIEYINLKFENKWKVNLGEVEKMIIPGKTKVISITTPHNPTGSVMS